MKNLRARKQILSVALAISAVPLAFAACWKNAASVQCPPTWNYGGTSCTLEPPDQHYMYANQCGEGSGTKNTREQQYCSYNCDGQPYWRYSFFIQYGGTSCELPKCGGTNP